MQKKKKSKIKGKRLIYYEINTIQFYEYLVKDQYGDVYRRGSYRCQERNKEEVIEMAKKAVASTVKIWNEHRKPNQDLFVTGESENE